MGTTKEFEVELQPSSISQNTVNLSDMRYGFPGVLAKMLTKRVIYKINAVSVVTSADMCQSICDTIIFVREECRV